METWLLALIVLIPVLVIGLLLWFLFEMRCYRIVDGRLYTREGLKGTWEDLEAHLKREHLGEWAMLQDSEGKLVESEEDK